MLFRFLYLFLFLALLLLLFTLSFVLFLRFLLAFPHFIQLKLLIKNRKQVVHNYRGKNQTQLSKYIIESVHCEQLQAIDS